MRKDRLSLIEFGFIEFILFTILEKVLLAVILTLFIDGNIENIDFIMDFVIDILLLFLKILFIEFGIDVALLQPALQNCVLLGDLINDFQQLFYLECLGLLCLPVLKGI
jgi:hypothetical protein